MSLIKGTAWPQSLPTWLVYRREVRLKVFHRQRLPATALSENSHFFSHCLQLRNRPNCGKSGKPLLIRLWVKKGTDQRLASSWQEQSNLGECLSRISLHGLASTPSNRASRQLPLFIRRPIAGILNALHSSTPFLPEALFCDLEFFV